MYVTVPQHEHVQQRAQVHGHVYVLAHGAPVAVGLESELLVLCVGRVKEAAWG